MLAQSIFGLECLFTMITFVAEVSREVGTFNMVPDIINKMRVQFSTQGALVAWPPILKHGLLHVLVKHLPVIRAA